MAYCVAAVDCEVCNWAAMLITLTQLTVLRFRPRHSNITRTNHDEHGDTHVGVY